MSARPRIACLVGTRPEAIKMAPVIAALRRRGATEARVVASGQHRELVSDALAVFGLRSDVELDALREGQSLAELTSRLLTGIDRCFASERPALVVAQGDTTTVLASALAAFYRGIPFAHVEAGLRSFDPGHPFPEEANRSLVGRLATLHFAPLEENRRQLLAEGVEPERILVTGNPVVDAVRLVARRGAPLPVELPRRARLVLLTVHRRENHGEPIRSILAAAAALLERHADVHLVVPVHPNPAVAGDLHGLLGGRARAHLVPPLDYPALIATLARAAVALTDSGGLQEEAPVLGTPLLVLRRTTERREAVEAGAAELVGADPERIGAATDRILAAGRRGRPSGRSLYGDGRSGPRIAGALERFLAGRPLAGATAPRT